MVIVIIMCKSARYLFIKRVFSCSSFIIQFESEYSSIGKWQNRLFIGNGAALYRKYKYEINISGQMKSTCGIISLRWVRGVDRKDRCEAHCLASWALPSDAKLWYRGMDILSSPHTSLYERNSLSCIPFISERGFLMMQSLRLLALLWCLVTSLRSITSTLTMATWSPIQPMHIKREYYRFYPSPMFYPIRVRITWVG